MPTPTPIPLLIDGIHPHQPAATGMNLSSRLAPRLPLHLVPLILALLLILLAQPANAWNPYMGCRMACNAAYLSCMNVYGASPRPSASLDSRFLQPTSPPRLLASLPPCLLASLLPRLLVTFILASSPPSLAAESTSPGTRRKVRPGQLRRVRQHRDLQCNCAVVFRAVRVARVTPLRHTAKSYSTPYSRPGDMAAGEVVARSYDYLGLGLVIVWGVSARECGVRSKERGVRREKSGSGSGRDQLEPRTRYCRVIESS
jgi:hypothetical protein